MSEDLNSTADLNGAKTTASGTPDEDGHCIVCGLELPDERETLEPHECPPGFNLPKTPKVWEVTFDCWYETKNSRKRVRRKIELYADGRDHARAAAFDFIDRHSDSAFVWLEFEWISTCTGASFPREMTVEQRK